LTSRAEEWKEVGGRLPDVVDLTHYVQGRRH